MIKGWLNTNIPPEALLTKYATTGHSKYLNLLVGHFNQMLYHYVLSQSDVHTAEDVIQNTWIKVIKSADKYQFNTNVKSWLFTIARNTLIDELRRQQRWQWQDIDDPLLDSSALKSSDFSPEKNLTKQERLALFNHVIASLSFHQREAFIFQQEGFSVEDICQLTNENFETVKSRLRYAKQRIKNELELINESE